MKRKSAEHESRVIISNATSEGRASLFEFEAERVATLYGIPVLKSVLARKDTEATMLARKIGYPVAMKIVSKDILHKTDVGGVKLNIQSSEEAEKSFRAILRSVRKANRHARIEGILIQKMAERPPYEFVVGAIRDKQFGPTVMFGLGGIYIEIFQDVTFRLAPVTPDAALSMIKEIKSSALLRGFRGSAPLDTISAAKVISRVGKIMMDCPEIESIDINPLFIYRRGVLAADVRMILKPADDLHNPKA